MTGCLRVWLAGAAALMFVSGSSLGTVVPQQAQSPANSAEITPAFIAQYCAGCHNNTLKSGGLSLEAISVTRPGEAPEVWEKVVKKLRGRMMPPLGRPRPDEATYNAVVSRLERSLDAAAASNPNPGRTETFRRLNRTEYQNAIRDLLALEVDVTALLPKDDASHGFDNVGVGNLSPTLLERYLAAAQKISRLAAGTPASNAAVNVVTLPVDLTQEGHMEGLP
jgi:hypothetical protein